MAVNIEFSRYESFSTEDILIFIQIKRVVWMTVRFYSPINDYILIQTECGALDSLYEQQCAAENAVRITVRCTTLSKELLVNPGIISLQINLIDIRPTITHV